jgi:hypothetical protein
MKIIKTPGTNYWWYQCQPDWSKPVLEVSPKITPSERADDLWKLKASHKFECNKFGKLDWEK